MLITQANHKSDLQSTKVYLLLQAHQLAWDQKPKY